MRVLRRSLLAAAWLALAIPASAQDPEVPPAPEAVVQVTDVLAGIGDEALPSMIVIVHYTGWLHDPSARDGRGKQFDSSRDRRQPFSFPLGAGARLRPAQRRQRPDPAEFHASVRERIAVRRDRDADAPGSMRG